MQYVTVFVAKQYVVEHAFQVLPHKLPHLTERHSGISSRGVAFKVANQKCKYLLSYLCVFKPTAQACPSNQILHFSVFWREKYISSHFVALSHYSFGSSTSLYLQDNFLIMYFATILVSFCPNIAHVHCWLTIAFLPVVHYCSVPEMVCSSCLLSRHVMFLEKTIAGSKQT